MEIGEKNIEKKIKTKDNNLQFLYYYKDKKILFCLGESNFYLINFNISIPEIIQVKQKPDNLGVYIKSRYKIFEDDCIYFLSVENFQFYDLKFLNIYKIVDGELKLISKNEIYKNNKSCKTIFL